MHLKNETSLINSLNLKLDQNDIESMQRHLIFFCKLCFLYEQDHPIYIYISKKRISTTKYIETTGTNIKKKNCLAMSVPVLRLLGWVEDRYLSKPINLFIFLST